MGGITREDDGLIRGDTDEGVLRKIIGSLGTWLPIFRSMCGVIAADAYNFRRLNGSKQTGFAHRQRSLFPRHFSQGGGGNSMNDVAFYEAVGG